MLGALFGALSIAGQRHPWTPAKAVIGAILIALGGELLRQAASAPIEALAYEIGQNAEYAAAQFEYDPDLASPAPSVEVATDYLVLHPHQHAETE